jgi:hypothetical protein
MDGEQKMKRTIALLAAVGVLGATSAASAQGWISIRDRSDRVDMRIDRGVRDGSLTRREAARLRNELRQIAFLEDRYSRNGLNGWERTDLNRRYDALSSRVFAERRDRQNRRYGYGYGPVNPYR